MLFIPIILKKRTGIKNAEVLNIKLSDVHEIHLWEAHRVKLFLAEYLQYAKSIWSKLGINQRISLAIVVLMVFGLLIGIFVWSSKPQYALLYSRMEQTDASIVVEKLRDSKIPYTLKNNGTSIYVPANQVYDLRLELAGEGIPRVGKGIGFEIFDKTNIGITDFVQKMNYIRAIQGEVARTITQLEEVAGARVHIVLPEDELFEADQKEATSSIAITLKPGAVLTGEQVNAIRYLTASAVEGLEPNNITIIDQYGNILSKTAESDSLDTLNAKQLEMRKNIEHHLSTKVQSMLEAAMGLDNAIVRVSVDLNFDQLEVTEEKFDPESAVVRSEQIMSEKKFGRNTAGAAGTPSNLSNEETVPADENSAQKETIQNTYEIDRKVQTKIQAAGDLKKVSAAVFLRKLRDAEGNYINRDAQEMQQLEDVIKSAIGYDEKRNDLVTVKEIVFQQSDTAKDSNLMSIRRTDFIMTIVKHLSVVAVIIILLVIFLKLMKNSRIDDGIVSSKKQNELPTLEDGEEPTFDIQLPRVDMEMRQKSLMYHKAISKVAQDHPDNVVQILKSWLADNK
ncbi:MAG: flagellar M-ring protein FliF [Candidatus Auribacter fodinae]|uniref:Flagellar M-ring protein n=1 Tax=Candidatus Auribacter fodinae TaxID=2093366 RepID=A0A3A4R4X2_9BACT|nr:MAG: flagellar M-ring protein FliF [Candidatus Auribacter fodinae]